MKSMTGYGRGQSSAEGVKVTVEVGSVNRKQTEVIVTLPRELDALERPLREEAARQIARGRLTVRVAWQPANGRWTGEVRLNLGLAKAYARELNRLREELQLPGPLSLEALLRVPGVLGQWDDSALAEQFGPAVRSALEKALESLQRMRAREGAHLAADLRRRVATLRRLVARVQKQAPAVLQRYREQLRQRIQKAGLEHLEPDDERLLKEVVLFADRSDISEELTRLQSHFQQFDDCLKSSEPVGRTLDFLAQEMGREVNTLGAKANDTTISRAVVLLKTELEKFREQVQNVE